MDGCQSHGHGLKGLKNLDFGLPGQGRPRSLAKPHPLLLFFKAPDFVYGRY